MKLARALRLLDSARRAAEEMGVAMAFAVVDAGGNPVAMLRMDGASIVATNTVVAKARTATHFGRPTARQSISCTWQVLLYGGEKLSSAQSGQSKRTWIANTSGFCNSRRERSSSILTSFPASKQRAPVCVWVCARMRGRTHPSEGALPG